MQQGTQHIRRRQLLIAAAGAAAAPLALMHSAASAQTAMRRVGVLIGFAESDPEAQARLVIFRERLAALGWAEGRNLTLDIRWSSGDAEHAARFAKELVALKPDILFAVTTPATAALQREAGAIPIVFAIVSDPIGSGFVKTLARPGGNITGFINLEASLIEKWLELLKEIAPRTKRAGVMFNPKTAPYADYYLKPLGVVAPKIGVKTFTTPVSSEADIEKAISTLGSEPGSGLIVMTDSFMTIHRKLLIAQTARHKLPAIHASALVVVDGGLISYGIDNTDLYRRAAPYVDRILRGAKPVDLPAQQPTLFELAVNLKTARALGLKVPYSIMVRADRVIE